MAKVDRRQVAGQNAVGLVPRVDAENAGFVGF